MRPWVPGWTLTVAVGVVLGVLASIPSLDGAAWRAVVFLAARAAPWVLLLLVLVVAAGGARWALRRLR